MPAVTGPSSCFARTSKPKMEACHCMHTAGSPCVVNQLPAVCKNCMHVYVSFEDTVCTCVFTDFLNKKQWSFLFRTRQKNTHGRKGDSMWPTLSYLRDLRQNNIQPNRVKGCSFGKIFPRSLCMWKKWWLETHYCWWFRNPKQPPEM